MSIVHKNHILVREFIFSDKLMNIILIAFFVFFQYFCTISAIKSDNFFRNHFENSSSIIHYIFTCWLALRWSQAFWICFFWSNKTKLRSVCIISRAWQISKIYHFSKLSTWRQICYVCFFGTFYCFPNDPMSPIPQCPRTSTY